MSLKLAAVCLTAVLVAAACATEAPSSVPASPAEPVSPGSSLAAAGPSALRSGEAPRALLIDDDGSGQQLRARPIDPRTLTDLPGYRPIPFGHHYVARVSPDGRSIAAILWPSGSANSGAVLHLIDTFSWTDRAVDFPINSFTSALRFDEKGTGLYWSQPTERATAQKLMRFDLGSGQLRELARLPDGFWVLELEVVGTRVALYLEPAEITSADARPADSPQLVMVDTRSGVIAAAVPLPGIRAGQFAEGGGTGAGDPNRMVEPGLAWDLPRGRVFVVDAESDRVFVIDLLTGARRGPFEPRPRRSMLDAFWSLFHSVAQAKMVSTTKQQAVVSPDGTRLYVAGQRSDFVKGADGKYHEVITPMDLRVIDTADMSELARLDGPPPPLWVSPDGAVLLYGTNRIDQASEGYAARRDFKTHARDTSAPYASTTIATDVRPWLVTFDASSRSGYLVGSTEGRASVLVFDLANRQLMTRRDMDRHFADVLLMSRQ